MYRNLHITFLFFLLVLIAPLSAIAQADLYGDCLKGYDFGSLTGDNLAISPINKACKSACKIECGSFSRKTSGGIELNIESISACTESCQNGKSYKGYLYEEYLDSRTNSRTLRVAGPISTAVSCSSEVLKGDLVTPSSFMVSAGDKISLRMLNNSDFNKIYMCGKKNIQLSPMIKSLTPADWSNEKSNTVLPDRASNMCAIVMDNQSWDTLTNYKMWNPSKPDKCSWNAKNIYYTDTGIWIKDGDELSISWTGTYLSKRFEKIANRKDLYAARKKPAAYGVTAQDVKKLFDEGGALSIMPPGSTAPMNPSGYPIFGELARSSDIDNPPTSRPDGASMPKPYYWNGLVGSVTDVNYKVNESKAAPNCDSADKRVQNRSICVSIDDPGVPFYSFSGILKGFSTTPSKLGIRHFDSNILLNFINHVGGLDVTVNWGGCPIMNGQNLQYAFGQTAPTPDSRDWRDVSSTVFAEGDPLVADKSGFAFFRIKPMDIPQGLPQSLHDLYTNPAHRYGQYYIAILKLGESGFRQVSGGPIKEIVNTVRETMYGTDTKKGVLEKLYVALIKDSGFITAVRSLLALYIAFTGLGYLLGIIQSNQKELLTRVVKIGFVVMIISPTSWDFFSNNFYKLFMDGGLELIALIGSASLDVSGQPIVDISKDPAQIFAIFDGPFKMIFSKSVWIKILALMLSGVLGFILAVIIIVSAVFYFLSLVKVVVMFLMSIVIIAILIFLAPLFFCFMLFNFTKQFFDSWWKYLLSFSLQPVVLFTSIAIFNLLIVMTLMFTLSFTACPGCLFKIYIPGIVDYCLIPVYYILAASHYPTAAPFLLPPGAIEGSIILLILSQGMYAFCEMISSVTTQIITGQMMFTASLASYGGQALGSVRSIFGIDEQSKGRRAQEAQAAHIEAMKKAESSKKER